MPLTMAFVLAVVILSLMCLAAIPVAWRLWTNQAPFFDAHGDRKIDRIQRARARSLPSVVVSAFAMICAAVTNMVDPIKPHGTLTGLQVVTMIFGLAFFGFGICSMFVFSYNRPKCLVPPHLREGPGYRDTQVPEA
jgi:hypothetical protein